MSKVRILVAADDPGFQTSLVFALEADDLSVAIAETVDSERFAAHARDAAAVLIDHRPGGLDGPALLEGLRTCGVATPVIVIAGGNSPGVLRRIAAAGGEWIEKPLLGSALMTAVRRIATNGNEQG